MAHRGANGLGAVVAQDAVQLGLVEDKPIRLKNVSKPLQGHFEKTGAGVPPTRILKEIRLTGEPEASVGDQVKADMFADGDKARAREMSQGPQAGEFRETLGIPAGAVVEGMFTAREGTYRAYPIAAGRLRPGRVPLFRITGTQDRYPPMNPHVSPIVLVAQMYTPP